MTEAMRHNLGKPNLALLSPIALVLLTRVLERGAIKYASHNWRNGFDKSELVNCIMRHTLEFLAGNDTDHETGLPIMAHIMCNAMFCLELDAAGKATDSRYKYDKDLMNLLESYLAGKHGADNSTTTK